MFAFNALVLVAWLFGLYGLGLCLLVLVRAFSPLPLLAEDLEASDTHCGFVVPFRFGQRWCERHATRHTSRHIHKGLVGGSSPWMYLSNIAYA
jgi:hypothetical protein